LQAAVASPRFWRARSTLICRSPPCPAVVVVLSPDFVRKKWPMRELEAALARPLRDPGATGGGGGEGEPVTLLPVLVDGLRVEDLGDAQSRLYGPRVWPSSRERPRDEVLTAWAALLKRVSAIVCMREDQARAQGLWVGPHLHPMLSPWGMQGRVRATPGPDAWRAACCAVLASIAATASGEQGVIGLRPTRPLLRLPPDPGADACRVQARSFQGGLAQVVAGRCVDELIRSSHLAQSRRVAAGLLPMQLQRPGCVVGRGADMDAVRLGLQEKRCVLLTGGPGEGKSTLACAVGAALWDEGAYQQGAFSLDMTGGQRAPVACEGRAAWPVWGASLAVGHVTACELPALNITAHLQAGSKPA
jgi:hypothetical protein